MQGEWQKVESKTKWAYLPYIELNKIDLDREENRQIGLDFNVTSVPFLVKMQGGVKNMYNGDRSAQSLLQWIYA
jgi:hypothetical protein